MEGARQQQGGWRKQPSWRCTLLTQALLCIALYAAFNLGSLQDPRSGEESSGYYVTEAATRCQDLYFMSVGGGARPLQQQAQLLWQMENVARKHRAAFVVNLSELGDNDPLAYNAIANFPSLKIPWYATVTSVEQGTGYYLKQIRLPHDRTLDIISLNTGLWEGLLSKKEQGDIESDQLHWLIRTLSATHSNWCLVVGFHSLSDCEESHTAERLNFYKHLHNIFMTYRVNAYLSNEGSRSHYTHEGGILYLRNGSLKDKNCSSHAGNDGYEFDRETCDGFHLHRVGTLDIESYFINSSGDVLFTSRIHQWGREDM